MPDNQNIRHYRAKTVTNYRKPQIKRLASGWYVEFHYLHQDKWHRFRYKDGVNRIKDLKKKETFAKQLQVDLNQLLIDGWNPCIQEVTYSLADCIDLLLDEIQQNSAFKTLSHYRSVWGLFHKWCENQGIGIDINDIKPSHIIAFLETKNTLSVAGKNRYIQGLKNLYNRLIEKGIVKENIVKTKSTKPKAKKYIPLKIEEKTILKNHLTKVHPRLLLFIEVMFYTGLRPKEILSLKYENLYETGIILYSTHAKTRTQRTAPLNSYLRDKLVGDSNHYIFGHQLVSQYRAHPLRRDRVTQLWREIVKQDLGINKNLYSIRHLSAIEHWKINKDLYALRDFLGHSTISMTENYMRSLIGFNLELNTNSGIQF